VALSVLQRSDQHARHRETYRLHPPKRFWLLANAQMRPRPNAWKAATAG